MSIFRDILVGVFILVTSQAIIEFRHYLKRR